MSQPLFAFNVGDWFVGATGLDGEILGMLVHPAIAITLMTASTTMTILHIHEKWKSGDLFDNPDLCSLRLDTPEHRPVKKHVTSSRSVKSAADFVPEVSSCGGEDVSLEIRPSVTGQYYGYGWLGGNGVTRTKKFDILWQDSHNIRSGDTATILIATLDDASLNVWSSGYSIVHENNSWGWRRQGSSSPTDWLTLRVEIRASEFDGAWEHHYRFRLTSDRINFEIEEI